MTKSCPKSEFSWVSLILPPSHGRSVSEVTELRWEFDVMSSVHFVVPALWGVKRVESKTEKLPRYSNNYPPSGHPTNTQHNIWKTWINCFILAPALRYPWPAQELKYFANASL